MMKVLVAGLSKTGTKTMAAALRLLGYKVYDWMENFYYLGDDWHRQVGEGFKMEDMRRMYENVDAVMDGPCDVYWEEIFDAFPDVKVVLTTREESSWVKSWQNQCEQVNSDIRFSLSCILTYTGAKGQAFEALSASHLAKYKTWPNFGRVPFDEESLVRVKRRHERNVKQIVPSNQLLVFQVKDGWEPLCAFLNVPIPAASFPHKNKGGVLLDEFREECPVMKRIETELFISLVCLSILFAICLYVMTKLI